jgi:DNA-binding transcriptional ArsR family regulator
VGSFLEFRLSNPVTLSSPMETKDEYILYNDPDIIKAARCLKAMSHPLRLKILCVLGTNSVSVQDIVEQVGTSQSNISQHLAILREKNILGHKKEANRVYYYIDDERMLQLIKMMQDVFCSS